MTTIVSPENHTAQRHERKNQMTQTISTLDGRQLSDILGSYLSKIGEAELKDNSEAVGADEVLCEIFRTELDEIAASGASIDASVTWIASFCINASAVAMNESPREAIAKIDGLVLQLRERLRELIDDAWREAA